MSPLSVSLSPFPKIQTVDQSTLGHLESALSKLAEMVALACVCGMLVVAGVTAIDVLLRWIVVEPIPAMNEIVQMTFSVAIAACIPAGIARRVDLKIDLVARYFTPSMHAWCEVLGGTSLFLFYSVIAWRIYEHANDLARQGAITVILGILQAPFTYCVSLFLGFAAVVQAVIVLNDLRRAWSHGAHGIVGAGISCVLIILCAFVWIFNANLINSWASAHVGTTVIIVFIVMWLMTLVLLPIASIMGIVGVISSSMFIGLLPSLGAASTEVTDFLGSFQLAALPLFLLMGSFAAIADISQDVYNLAHVAFGRLRGGLALTTIAGCAGFGALTGHSISTTVTIGKVAIPEMRARGYSPALSTGVVAAGGTLGALLPPASGMLILFALLSESSVGQLFVAALLPGLLAISLYLATIGIYVRLSPQSAPVSGIRETGQLLPAAARCGPALLLFGSVLFGIYAGIFTTTEAGAVGALEAFLCALWRGKLRGKAFWHVLAGATATTAMMYSLLFGAQIFSFFVAVSGLTEAATAFMAHLDWAPLTIVSVILIAYLLLGSVMESFAVMIITVPIITPLVLHLGFDIRWWGILNLCVVETGLIHPPLGLNVFILKSFQPDVSIWTIYKGVTPFVIADLLKLILLVLFPTITLWLPSMMAP